MLHAACSRHACTLQALRDVDEAQREADVGGPLQALQASEAALQTMHGECARALDEARLLAAEVRVYVLMRDQRWHAHEHAHAPTRRAAHMPSSPRGCAHTRTCAPTCLRAQVERHFSDGGVMATEAVALLEELDRLGRGAEELAKLAPDELSRLGGLGGFAPILEAATSLRAAWQAVQVPCTSFQPIPLRLCLIWPALASSGFMLPYLVAARHILLHYCVLPHPQLIRPRCALPRAQERGALLGDILLPEALQLSSRQPALDALVAATPLPSKRPSIAAGSGGGAVASCDVSCSTGAGMHSGAGGSVGTVAGDKVGDTTLDTFLVATRRASEGFYPQVVALSATRNSCHFLQYWLLPTPTDSYRLLPLTGPGISTALAAPASDPHVGARPVAQETG